jgi:hypothetical protein
MEETSERNQREKSAKGSQREKSAKEFSGRFLNGRMKQEAPAGGPIRTGRAGRRFG